MADIEVLSADMRDGRINNLTIRFKGNLERKIDRDKTLLYLREGHSLIPVHGHGHQIERGPGLLCIEVEGEAFVRSDTTSEASDQIHFPGHHSH
jgi:hypothetical protein